MQPFAPQARFYGRSFDTHVECSAQRVYSDELPRPPWLLTLDIGHSGHGQGFAYPQARAVVDDYGTLQVVGGWL